MTISVIEQAFILGAGMGSRMRPLTDEIPKPLVPLDGRPLIDHVINRLQAVGVKTFIVNVHHLADKLEAHLKSLSGVNIIISDERGALLDTGGGLMKARHLLKDEPFFIHNSDSVWLEDPAAPSSNLARMVEAFDETSMQSLMLLANRHEALGYNGRGDFLINADNTLTRRKGDETTDHVFAGVSIAHPSLMHNAPEGAFSLNRLWNRALDKGSIYGIRHQGLWMHVGTMAALSEAEQRTRQQMRKLRNA